jgi:hypothetical protein
VARLSSEEAPGGGKYGASRTHLEHTRVHDVLQEVGECGRLTILERVVTKAVHAAGDVQAVQQAAIDHTGLQAHTTWDIGPRAAKTAHNALHTLTHQGSATRAINGVENGVHALLQLLSLLHHPRVIQEDSEELARAATANDARTTGEVDKRCASHHLDDEQESKRDAQQRQTRTSSEE